MNAIEQLKSTLRRILERWAIRCVVWATDKVNRLALWVEGRKGYSLRGRPKLKALLRETGAVGALIVPFDKCFMGFCDDELVDCAQFHLRATKHDLRAMNKYVVRELKCGPAVVFHITKQTDGAEGMNK